MRIDRILASIKEEKALKAAQNLAEKTASETPTGAPHEALVAALTAATEKTASEKRVFADPNG